MAGRTKEEVDIDAINDSILAALKILTGAGGWADLVRSPKALGIIAKGVMTDHTHKGYKEVTMDAFQQGIQTMLKNSYVALKLLEADTLTNDELKTLVEKLKSPRERKHILKILGFSKKDRDVISSEINGLLKKQNQNDSDLVDLLKTKINMTQENKEDRKQRLEMMISGALCYLPFAEPHDGHELEIPIKDQAGKYHLKKMDVEKINMSQPPAGPYYALQLRPVEIEGTKGVYAQPHLLFMGTNPLPTSSGPSVTIQADTFSGKSIGENLVEQSSELFEKMIKQQFKENLINLINNHSDEFTGTDDEVNYEKLWLAARVKCEGQSLGGSISLQMYAKYPFMVEVSAFEPPFLLEKHRDEMEVNLENAHDDYVKIIKDIQGDIPDSININKLKQAVPSDTGKLDEILKANNIVIAQLTDYATKFGTVAPPATILHVQYKEATSTYAKIKNSIFETLMAVSLLSHAKVLAGDKDKVIVRKENLNELFSKNSRVSFTKALDSVVWKVINKPMTAYIDLKRFFLDNVYDPKDHASKNPKYREAHKRILEKQIAGKNNIIDRAEAALKLDANDWRKGEYLEAKKQELERLKRREVQLFKTPSEKPMTILFNKAVDKVATIPTVASDVVERIKPKKK